MVKIVQTASEKFFNKLEQKIVKAQLEGKPINDFVEQQIKIISEVHDEFISNAKLKGYDMKDPQLAEVEIQQYSKMKELAQKIGLPVEKYDKLIKEVRIRVFGEEGYKKFFRQ